MGLAAVLAAIVLATPGAAAPAPSALTPASGNSTQWAFGGSASLSFSCSGSTCTGGSSSAPSGISESFQYYIEWVVIYTETNVSSTQTMVEAQEALNASASVSATACLPSSSSSGCSSTSFSLSLSGRESAIGFTNLTTGSVTLSSPTSGSTPAWAVTNAQSNETFNFSGAFNAHNSTTSAGITFDVGANEGAAVSFSPSLGIVPLDPSPGETWNSSAPYTAHGSYTTGYTFAYNEPGNSSTVSNWTHGNVGSSGTLTVDGTDLGAYTLTDNYTQPPSSVTAQSILLNFGSGDWSATDGWLMVPTSTYGGLLTGLSYEGALAVMPTSGVHPSEGPTSLTSTESAYYQKGKGFIGANATGSTASASTGTGLTGPVIKLQAGPEPVSVAEQQYSAILTPSSSSSSFPWVWLIVAVVAVVVVVVGVVAWRRTKRPPAPSPMGTVPTGAAPTPAAEGAAPPTDGSSPPPPGGPGTV